MFFWLGQILLLVFLFSSSVQAGGPLNLSDTGVASSWDSSSTISYHPEDGTCGPFSNAEILTRFDGLMDEWTGLSEVDFSMTQVAGSLGSVDSTNYDDFLYLSILDSTALITDSLNPIIFDDDAEIIAQIAGEENKYLVLGFAGAVGFNTDNGTINDGQAVINCRCIVGDSREACTIDSVGTIELSEAELDFTILHEMGHFLNLGHSNLNSDLFQNDDATDDANIPVMFPLSFESETGITPRTDDISALASIYPSTEFNSDWCTVTGILTDADDNPLNCADVWAVASDVSNSVSNVTGAYLVGTDGNSDGDKVDDGECTSNCGKFVVRLKKDLAYDIKVRDISSSFVGASSVGPCVNSQLTTITKENLYTVSSAACVGGVSVDVGTLKTTSTGGSSETSGGTTSGATTTGDAASDKLNPVGYGCSLSFVEPKPQGSSNAALLMCFGGVALLYGLRRQNLSS